MGRGYSRAASHVDERARADDYFFFFPGSLAISISVASPS